jgi:hypothetical protein
MPANYATWPQISSSLVKVVWNSRRFRPPSIRHSKSFGPLGPLPGTLVCMKLLLSGKERMFWRILLLLPIFLILGLGFFVLGMDADSDPWMSSDAGPGTLDSAVETNLCCGPGNPPGCRVPGPKQPLTPELHRRAQVR